MSTRFGIGNVLATGFRVWAKNVVPFLLITAMIYSPVLIWNITAVQGEMTHDRVEGALRALRLSRFALGALGMVLSAALTYGVVMELQGQRASIGACITTGLTRFFPALGVTFVASMAIGFGILLLIIPGIIAFCMLYVATQCSAVERPGVAGALERSMELTKGHRLRIFALAVLLGVLGFAAELVVAMVTLSSADDLPVYVYVVLAQQMVVGSISAVMGSVVYYLLRAEKEGTSAAELAAIFG